MTRSESKRAMLVELGAVPVVADALDPDQVAEAVAAARPEVIVHQLTAIGSIDTRHMERDFAATNRLRIGATDHLLSAGQAVGVRRFVAQSNIAAYGRIGGPVKSEEDPYDRAPARQARANLEAMVHLEQAVLGAQWTEGIVLRYGWFYGPAHRWRRTATLSPSGADRRTAASRSVYLPWIVDGATTAERRLFFSVLRAPIRLINRLLWEPRYTQARTVSSVMTAAIVAATGGTGQQLAGRTLAANDESPRRSCATRTGRPSARRSRSSVTWPSRSRLRFDRRRKTLVQARRSRTASAAPTFRFGVLGGVTGRAAVLSCGCR